ncbi:hypothetical protein [Streptomyces sp. NBRC 110035]|uniref:hypothetical protein n=1 Tax=Streptomyces sp. NBRC 110035 TaxID=1547867 RepID=UPI0005A8D6DE|nr:hypothetical protein [Streptomyces sp. NBRC 110035]
MNDSPTATVRERVLAALALPALDGLTQAQVRGATCVWDGIALTAGTAVDLGPRKKRRPGGTYSWFPRGCKRCTARRAYRALFDHAPACGLCRKGPECPVSVEVHRLIREGGGLWLSR